MTTKITDKNISELANAGVNWQSVFTGDGSTGLTAVAGRGYFINTTSGTVTVTLPASPNAGDVVVLKDYARTWNTNNVTLASALMDGNTAQKTFDTQGATVTLVYMDGTKGWTLINEDTTSQLIVSPTFIAATGGTIATSGDYKIHTFTGDGCFVVSTTGNAPLIPTGGPDVVDYLVVAGGGSGGADVGGGGGGGGFRESHSTPVSGCYTASPLATPTGITVSATTYPVTVGAGGAAPGPCTTAGNSGSNSVFSTITSTGGGRGGGGPAPACQKDGTPGGSGGGGGGWNTAGQGGCGNTPVVSPPQGNNGGDTNSGGSPGWTGSGGGGAGGTGANGTPGPLTTYVCGGTGATSSITASPVTYSFGGTGGGDQQPSATTTVAPANSGGGGGGGGNYPTPNVGNAGGKGIVIIRYKYQ